MRKLLCLLGFHSYRTGSDRVETAPGCPVWIMTLSQCSVCGHVAWFHEEQTDEMTEYDQKETP